MKLLNLLVFLALMVILQCCVKDPVANFEYSYVDNLAPAEVTFTNLSTEADKFQWDFGDGTTSAEENPEHAFIKLLHPNVSLVARGRGGENRITKTIEITSYFVRNSSSYPFYNLVTFFWDGENVVDDFDLGDLAFGYDSDVVATTHDVIDVALELPNGVLYLVKYSYTLNKDQMSFLEITDKTSLIPVPASKKGTKSQLDSEMIRENGQGILLKDLMPQ